jgi:hypothetical protein
MTVVPLKQAAPESRPLPASVPEYMPLAIVPVFQHQAKAFIAQHHRHNAPSLSSIFNVGLECDGKLVGVAMVGLPKARMSNDGRTLEVTRVCVLDDVPNGNSMLYGACARTAKALGWARLLTYTLPTESGASLKASGWKLDDGLHGGGDWTRCRSEKTATDLFGSGRHDAGPKRRWRKSL